MNDRLWVDPENLRARGAAFREFGDEVQQITKRLNEVLSREGRWWGGDESGVAFEQSYEPDARRVTAALRALADALHGFGGQMAETAGELETADTDAAKHIRDLDELAPHPSRAAASPRAPAPDAATSPLVPAPDGAASVSAPAPNADRFQLHPAPGSPGLPASVAAPSAVLAGEDRGTPVGAPMSSSGTPWDSAPPDSPTGASSAAGDGATTARNEQPPSGPAGTPAPSTPGGGDRERPARRDGPAVKETERKQPNSATSPTRNAVPPAVSARGGHKRSGTPWSEGRTSPGRPQVAAPDRRHPGKSDRVGKPAQDRPRSGRDVGDRNRSRGPMARPVDESMLMRRARTLGERHGAEPSGFEAADLDEAAVTEFLDATDDVLTRYPVLPVSRIGIGVTGGTGAVRVARCDGENLAPTWSVILNSDLFGGAEPPIEAVRRQQKPGADHERPLYSATVREFGRAFDLAGGCHARHRAQRALIAEYLRGDKGYRDTHLARVVEGYKRWRDQLSGGSFDKGRFDAAEALADGFTEVLLRQDAACEPAKTLCHLLLEHAVGRKLARTAAGGTDVASGK
ncbi:hypothetical protein ACFXNW_21800 [Nocardia sp. NPDC059180]|uniref:WXG100 family type VII secretion target n=1 Tax=Nocardia sp. NPDC059180 TaxID=3346761 RepID=UPI0036C57786